MRWAIVFLLMLFWWPPFLASKTSAADGSVAISQIEFTASLSLDAIQDKLRLATAEVVRQSPPSAKTYGPKTVRVTVTPTVVPSKLSVTGLSRGGIKISVPVQIRIDTAISGGAELAVYAEGCDATTFTLSGEFVPLISKEGLLNYRLGAVSTNNKNYKCKIVSNTAVDAGKHIGEFIGSGFGLARKPDYSKAVEVNVSSRTQSGLKAFGREAFSAQLSQFNALLPDENDLYALLRKPAMFGKALTLGIDAPRLRVSEAVASGRSYRVIGVLEGRPRLVFGDAWTPVSEFVEQTAKPGFHLPARLLFPTKTSLLPYPAAQLVSGCAGSFRLSQVPDRIDLAVLQRCEAGDNGNVIWLSGARDKPSGKVHAYNRSMSNVLSEIIDWLGDAKLWRGVEGAARLRQEMVSLQARLNAFQQGTQLPVDTRGTIHFHSLSVDLSRVWVSEEAILADVILNGKARLEMNVSI